MRTTLLAGLLAERRAQPRPRRARRPALRARARVPARARSRGIRRESWRGRRTSRAGSGWCSRGAPREGLERRRRAGRLLRSERRGRGSAGGDGDRGRALPARRTRGAAPRERLRRCSSRASAPACLGQVHPRVAAHFEVPAETCVAELDWEALLEQVAGAQAASRRPEVPRCRARPGLRGGRGGAGGEAARGDPRGGRGEAARAGGAVRRVSRAAGSGRTQERGFRADAARGGPDADRRGGRRAHRCDPRSAEVAVRRGDPGGEGSRRTAPG